MAPVIDPQRPISLYLHVPFCKELCWYCGCHTAVDAAVVRRSPTTSSVLIAEIALVADANRRPLSCGAVISAAEPRQLRSKDFLTGIFARLRRSLRLCPPMPRSRRRSILAY